MAQQPSLSDRELLGIWRDERTTDEDLALMTPDEQERLLTLVGADSGDASAEPDAGLLATVADLARDLGIGGVKGLGRSAVGLGELVSRVPGMGAVTETVTGVSPEAQAASFEQARSLLAPEGGAQALGMGAEQVAEFMLPGGVVRRGMQALPRVPALARGMLGEAATAGGVGSLQAGEADPVSAALGATGPLVGRGMGAVSSRLATGARSTLERFFNPTTQAGKGTLRRLVDEFTARRREFPLVGGREGVRETAEAGAEQAGTRIRQAEQAIRETPVDVRRAEQRMRRVARTGDLPGRPIQVQERSPIVDAFGRPIERVVTRPGPTASFQPSLRRNFETLADELGKLKDVEEFQAVNTIIRSLDKELTSAGVGTQRSARFLLNQADAAKANAELFLRRQLRNQLAAQHPEFQELNHQFSFFRRLTELIDDQVLRGTGGRPRLTDLQRRTAAAVAGGLSASASGNPLVTVAGAAGAERLARIFESPTYQFVSFRAKQALADALASGRPRQIADATGRLEAALLSVSRQRIGREERP